MGEVEVIHSVNELRPTYGPDEDRNAHRGVQTTYKLPLRPTYGPDEDRNTRDLCG